MTEPIHIADKLIYTAIALYAIATLAGMFLQEVLPYEQAKRVEWWTNTLAAIPFVAAFYFGMALIVVMPFLMLYVIWFWETTP